MLRIYLRLLRYLLPYWRRVVLALGAIVLYALLSGVSVTLVVPFLDNLFQQGPAAPSAVERVGGEVESSLGDASEQVARAKAWKDARLDEARAWLDRGAPGERLRRILVVIFLAFLLKNLSGYLETYPVSYTHLTLPTN